MLPAGGSAQYYVEDFLGSSRIVAQSNGVVCYDGDFTPFGGELPYTNSCPAQNNYKFEGKERDTETQNDDFGARYYSWRFGRWLSADWSAVPVPVPYANLTNPQTLNLYAMVADDPESFADLDGHGAAPSQCGYHDGTCPNGPGTTASDTSASGQQAAQAEKATAEKQQAAADPVISYEKNVPKMSPAAEKYVTGVLKDAGVISVTISATTNGKHDPDSIHYTGGAVDIDRVNGKAVNTYDKDKSVKAGTDAIQGAANSSSSGAARENYGPAGLYRGGKEFKNSRLQQEHSGHIHIAIPGSMKPREVIRSLGRIRP